MWLMRLSSSKEKPVAYVEHTCRKYTRSTGEGPALENLLHDPLFVTKHCAITPILCVATLSPIKHDPSNLTAHSQSLVPKIS
jgi:hypothetical protein